MKIWCGGYINDEAPFFLCELTFWIQIWFDPCFVIKAVNNGSAHRYAPISIAPLQNA